MTVCNLNQFSQYHLSFCGTKPFKVRTTEFNDEGRQQGRAMHSSHGSLDLVMNKADDLSETMQSKREERGGGKISQSIEVKP